jgi:FkbM family methyltransferase
VTREPFVSYAQNAEDVVLARALRPDENVGFWIDVGAGDPRELSVTAAFADRGWRGINIEPLPLEHERLCAGRPNDVNLQVALGARSGRGQLYAGPPENRGSSTLKRDLADRYVAEGQVFEPVDIRITTLAEVVDEHARDVVDFLKIDVEGSELDVLEGADWSAFRPRIIVIEATEPNTRRCNHEQWEPILLEQGYRCALFDGLNRFYASADEPALFDALSVPANIHDGFIPQIWARTINTSERNARHYHDRLAIALDEIATLRSDLDAVQRFYAWELRKLEAKQQAAAAAEAESAKLREELAAVRNTRLYRYTSSVRRAYGALRRR